MSHSERPDFSVGGEREKFRTAEDIMRGWKEKTPVFLSTTSLVRRQGVERLGFDPGNIHLLENGPSVEIDALTDYLANFNPSWVDPNGTVGVEHVAVAKIEKQYAPPDALVFAWDTMPIFYHRVATSYDAYDDSMPGEWKGVFEHKPKSIQEAAEVVESNFLLLIKNRLIFSKFLNEKRHINWQNLTKEARSRYYKIDFASGIHVKTAFAVRFPFEDTLTTYSDRIIVRPNKIFEIADSVKCSEDVISADLSAIEALSDSAGVTIKTKIVNLITELFAAMSQEGVFPTHIAGGIAYQLDVVRRLLKVEEMSNIVAGRGATEPDRSIYTGFPEQLVYNVLVEKAESIAKKQNLVK